MATITYNQAVAKYESQAKKLEKKYQNIKGDIAVFLDSAKKYIQKNASSSDQSKIQEIEKQLT